jgi:hypothetical protein
MRCKGRHGTALTAIRRITPVRRSQDTDPEALHVTHCELGLLLSGFSSPVRHTGHGKRTCPPSNSVTFPTTSTNFPICRCESDFRMRVTSPLFPHVIVAVSPWSAVTVPRIRTVCVEEPLEGWKAWRWAGRTRGVWRDISSFSSLGWLGYFGSSGWFAGIEGSVVM